MNKNLLRGGMFDLSAEDQQQIDALVRQTGLSGERRQHELMGAALAEPIRQTVPYVSWTSQFFVPMPIGPAEDNRIALDELTAVAFYSSPTGQVLYTRPGRKYTRPDFTEIDAGIEIGWRTMREAGWNIVARKQREATEELARKRDTLAATVINAAATASGNTSATAAGGVMTKAAVDNVFTTMGARGWNLRTVIGNTGTLMSMTNWTLANALWQWPDEMTRTLVTQFYWSDYGNCSWYGYHNAPTGYVYFACEPSQVGYHQTKGDIITASDVDITKKVDRHVYIEEDAYIIPNPYAVWRLTITA